MVKFLRSDFPLHVLDRVLDGVRCSGLKETSREMPREGPELPDGSGLVLDLAGSSSKKNKSSRYDLAFT